MYFLKQCELVKKTNLGVIKTVSWIPEKFAKTGKILRLKREEVWDNGWEVVLVGDERMPSKDIENVSRRHLKQRQASDV